ncbi:MAG: hypothetical protein OXI54_02335 [Chloroflexota bacterium]|nr:hypothetical protein [Chloroflexota bacterium]
MRGSRQRQTRQRRVSRRVNAWILGGYVGVAASAAALKAWQIVVGPHIVGWLAKTNAIVWDTITLAATLGALALGVREMVLAYFIRKEYEDEIAAIRAERDAALQQTQNDMLLQLIEQNRQLIEQNRQLIERLDRQSNGHSPETPDEP